MKSLRFVIVVSVVICLALLALLTKSFWWFTEGGVWHRDIKDIKIACVWAAVHGALSAPFAFFLLTTEENRAPVRSAVEYAVCLLIASTVSAAFLAYVDLASGCWMLIDGGAYISHCYGAFLQAFLIMYLLIILCTPKSVYEAHPEVP